MAGSPGWARSAPTCPDPWSCSHPGCTAHTHAQTLLVTAHLASHAEILHDQVDRNVHCQTWTCWLEVSAGVALNAPAPYRRRLAAAPTRNHRVAFGRCCLPATASLASVIAPWAGQGSCEASCVARDYCHPSAVCQGLFSQQVETPHRRHFCQTTPMTGWTPWESLQNGVRVFRRAGLAHHRLWHLCRLLRGHSPQFQHQTVPRNWAFQSHDGSLLPRHCPECCRPPQARRPRPCAMADRQQCCHCCLRPWAYPVLLPSRHRPR